ncbi:ferredoxin [Haloquadratum walsbyi]|uniref:Probable ferredoxin (4Fe-4S) n=1 Tax=Haloquadratum walsbyi (strain DSM 16854 / JCM 12705 / C23) TaxID=768065 RepID=G0LIG2_HALWC|nr:ferredoxin [Haloquadratum walsbyi]CCC39882.1 probable ferredoxin (4Fe-4S) [Haloquadratum walsbyi C23]
MSKQSSQTQSRYRVEIDLTACDGIFACLTRDDRFIEGPDGLATIDVTADSVVSVSRTADHIVAVLSKDADTAELAATACPPNAITVYPPSSGDASDDNEKTDSRHDGQSIGEDR